MTHHQARVAHCAQILSWAVFGAAAAGSIALELGAQAAPPAVTMADREAVRRAVLDYFSGREQDLLVVCWEAGHGWQELCRFLQRAPPDQPVPHENDRRDFEIADAI